MYAFFLKQIFLENN